MFPVLDAEWWGQWAGPKPLVQALPNIGVQATAYSARSYVAPASSRA